MAALRQGLHQALPRAARAAPEAYQGTWLLPLGPAADPAAADHPRPRRRQRRRGELAAAVRSRRSRVRGAHTFLPLSGVTHMTPQEVVAENLLRLELEFLRDALSGG